MSEPRHDEGCRPAEAGLHDEEKAKQPRRPRRSYSLAEKTSLLEAYQRRRQSVSAFCAAEDLTETNFRRWLKEAGLAPKKSRRTKTKARRRRRHFTPEEKRAAVEAFEKSQLSQADFCVTWGLSVPTLRLWLKRYREEGPKGLEPKPRELPESDPRRVPEEISAEILATKERHPDFGSRKVRDYLFRFRGMKVAAGTVKKTLDEAGLPALAQRPPRPRRGPSPPRRFERARPGELWQSDITSLVLRREGRRVYLTVFMDDHSRYVVAWSLRLSQRQELVCECLLDGIARFGKPLEVLTDQGRQYFAWRGKSGFQKLLDREGIRHVVSRTHHPQTLGKCERFWKTVQEEFWERAKPQDLHDARLRLGHFVAHYNHFRPHQGIGGLVPADRFFEAEAALRKTLEGELKDELGAALSEPRRRSVFLFGRVGEEEVSLHGERGELVLHRHGELRERIGMDELGQGRKESGDDERGEDAGGVGVEHEAGCESEHESEGGERGPGDRGAGGDADAERSVGSDAASSPCSPDAEADALCDARAGGAEREGALAGGEPEGPGACAPDGDADPRDLARQEDASGGGAGAGGAGAALLAAQPAGGLGYAGGSFDPAAHEEEPGDAEAQSGGGSAGADAADREAGAGAPHRERPDRGAEADPGSSPGSAGAGGEVSAAEEEGRDEAGASRETGRGEKAERARAKRRGGWWRGLFGR